MNFIHARLDATTGEPVLDIYGDRYALGRLLKSIVENLVDSDMSERVVRAFIADGLEAGRKKRIYREVQRAANSRHLLTEIFGGKQ